MIKEKRRPTLAFTALVPSEYMMGLTAAVVLAVVLGVSLEGCVGAGMGYGFASSKLQIQQRRVDRMQNSIEVLRSKVRHAQSNDDQDAIDELDKSLTLLDGKYRSCVGVRDPCQK